LIGAVSPLGGQVTPNEVVTRCCAGLSELARRSEFPVTIVRRVSGCALARPALRIECLP
jgi:hypothetical protein